MRVFGVSSCILLRARRNVDFPQPLGPMMAVTAFEITSRVTLSMASLRPYQIERFFTSKVNGGAGSMPLGASTGCSTRSITLRSGVSITKFSIREYSR
jgi:hypothetical protein